MEVSDRGMQWVERVERAELECSRLDALLEAVAHDRDRADYEVLRLQAAITAAVYRLDLEPGSVSAALMAVDILREAMGGPNA